MGVLIGGRLLFLWHNGKVSFGKIYISCMVRGVYDVNITIRESVISTIVIIEDHTSSNYVTAKP